MDQNAPLRYECFRDTGVGPRLGRVHTRHGFFDTPAFMPVGTQGTVKGILPDHLAATGSQIILGNTYHLMLRPGEKIVEAVGGLHRFMAWDGPILTDSGGFQVFSLSDINRITDKGVVFKSHIDGAMVDLTPARSIAVQNALGADIIMAFDQCPAADAPQADHVAAVERTLRWAAECKTAHARPTEQSLFAIVQGGTNAELRRRCALALVEMDFPGYAIGGLAVGEGFEAMVGVIEQVAPLLPADRPRYLMGVGFPRDIIAAISAGVDMFDCVMPTRNGRNAYAFTRTGPIRLRNSRFAADSGPVEAGCDCYCCRTFTRSAIRHYFFAGEMLGPILLSLHNIRFYQHLLADVRRAIGEETFDDFRREDPRCRMGPPGKELEIA
jgi:queuine tRNA-ribosyltransferase